MTDIEPTDEQIERAFLAVMNANDRELALPLSAYAERNLLKRRIAVALDAAHARTIAQEAEKDAAIARLREVLGKSAEVLEFCGRSTDRCRGGKSTMRLTAFEALAALGEQP